MKKLDRKQMAALVDRGPKFAERVDCGERHTPLRSARPRVGKALVLDADGSGVTNGHGEQLWNGGSRTTVRAA